MAFADLKTREEKQIENRFLLAKTSKGRITVRAIACKPRLTLLNDPLQIGLILTCMIEASLLCLLAKTASKKSVPISFYRTFTDSTEIH